MHAVTCRAVPAEFKTGMCEMKSRSEVLWGVSQNIGLGQIWEMHAVTWRAVLAEFKTGMCEMKSRGLRFCGVFGNGFRTGLRTCLRKCTL